MPSNPVGFEITNSTAGWNGADFDDVFIRKDCFLEGGLWLWGAGTFGNSGNNTAVRVSSPVQTISGGTNWKNISAGNQVNAAIKSDGTLWMWGEATGGALGNQSPINRSSPVQTVSAVTDWKQVSVGSGANVGAIKSDGSLWTWGLNTGGRLGDNTVTSRSSPVQTVSNVTTWKQVSAGGENMAAIKLDGTLWTWGSSINVGVLGNNVTGNIFRSSPIQTVSGGTNWKKVSAGYCNVIALKTDGTLWAWGDGTGGRNGDNTATTRSSPVQTIGAATNWKDAEHTGSGGIGIKTDGTLWAWGFTPGNNTTNPASSPVQTISGGTNWKSAIRSLHGGIKTDGTLWVWGANFGGVLGNDSVINTSSPVQTISGGTNWRQIARGVHVMGIREDCW